MPHGKFFYIQSKLNGMVMDIQGGGCSAGDHIITYPKKDDEEAANQLWFEDPVTGTIRSKKDADLVLDLDDDDVLIINTFDENKDSQKWKARGEFVLNRREDNHVLTVAGADDDAKATIWSRSLHGAENQQWEFDYLETRFFYIKSKMNGKVLDVKQADSSPGAVLITWEKHDDPEDNQMWFENRFGTICSKLNGFAIDAAGGDGENMALQPFDLDEPERLWSLFGDRIVHQLNRERVMDIKKKKNKNGAHLCAYDWCGDDNQLWEIEYID